jgi:hypothetical protein
MKDDQLRRQEMEQEAQEQFVDSAIHDGAYRYAAAAQAMFDTFRRDHVDEFAGDWHGFDMAQDFLAHANEELRRLVICRCAYLALVATAKSTKKRRGLLAMLSHACWQLTHFAQANDEPKKSVVREEEREPQFV